MEFYLYTMHNLSVRPVLSHEYKALADFGRETFYETWREYNTEEDMQTYLKYAFDEQKILEDLTDIKTNTFLFAFNDDLLVGYAKIRNDRTHDEFSNARVLEIERIYVRKNFQGKLVAQQLMEECLIKARTEQYEWLWLGVNIDNHRAIAFYKKYGFEIFGTKIFKLGDAEDQDYLMKLKLL